MKNKKTFGLVSMCALAISAASMVVVAANGIQSARRINADDTYSLSLNSSNGITGSDVTTTQTIQTDSGNYQVEFSYTDVSALSGGHCVINTDGIVVNKDHIRSVSEIQATFSGSGTLQFRTSFDGSTWGAYNTMVSEVSYTLSSYPYYIELSAKDGAVNLNSMLYKYTCAENPNAHEGTSENTFAWTSTVGESDSNSYLKIVGMNETSASSDANSGKTAFEERTNNFDTSIFTLTDISDIRFGASSKYNYFMIGGKSNDGYFTFTVASGYTVTSVVFKNALANASSYLGTLSVNDESNKMTTSSNTYTYTPNASTVTIKSSNYRTWVLEIDVTIKPDISAPADETGFTATDSKMNSYKDTDVFAESNGLSVYATFTDGTTIALTNGTAVNNYSYTITNASGEAIDPTQSFGAAGTYTLTVNYKSYIPVVITLKVEIDLYITSIDVSMVTTTFNTADILANNLSSNITANIIYNVASYNKTGVAYEDFSEYGITLSLINPSGVDADMSTVFGVAGTFTLKATISSTIFDEVSLTVSAIPVTNITLDQSELSLQVGQTGQLNATVSPDNATNTSFTWSSDNTSVATVSDSGLVTAKAVGTATVSATSNDGTNKVGSCLVTVTKSTNTTATLVANNTVTNTSTTVTFSASSFTATGISISDVTGSNIYGTSDGSFRFASNKKDGSITVTFSTATLIRGVSINAKGYDSDASVTVITSANSTGGSVTVSDTSAYADYTFDAFASDSTESTTLTISSPSKNRFYLNSITLTVGVLEPVYATGIKLTGTSNIGIGETTSLGVTYTPSNTNQKDITFSSNNTAVATVSNDGLVTGVSEGSATITATVATESSSVSATFAITVSKIAVTGISISAAKTSIVIGGTSNISATVTPSNATDQSVSWKSSNTSVATVSDGVVTGVAVGTATITATTNDGGYTDKVSIEVTEEKLALNTVLIYMCGADLESENGLASGDLEEIASVSGQTEDTNIVVEAGGASSWASTYSSVINKSYLNRFHLSNKGYVKDEQITKASMGLSSTLQSFLEWGIQTYPAQNYGLILWNHGGGMWGVCYDENYKDNSLYDNEVVSAVTGARNTLGITDKFKWIGYDACLMGLQDVAEFNSPYFEYMVAAQESEAGYGWDYDTWVDNLFAGDDYPTIFKAICDGFITDNGGVSASGSTYNGTYYPADQTLAYYDLSKMAAYKEAWENLAGQLKNKITSSNKSSFNTDLIGKTKYFAGSDYDYFCEFDAYHFLTLLESNSTFNPGSSYITAAKNALKALVGYNAVQKEAAHDAYGISFYYVAGDGYGQETFSSSTYSNFTNWTYLSSTYGGSITSTYSY